MMEFGFIVAASGVVILLLNLLICGIAILNTQLGFNALIDSVCDKLVKIILPIGLIVSVTGILISLISFIK